MARLPLNCFSIWGIICISLTPLFLFPQFVWFLELFLVLMFVGLMSGLPIPQFILNFGFVLILNFGLAFIRVPAIIAIPLTFKGAQKYLKEKDSTGLKGLMITAWAFYGIDIFMFCVMIAVGGGLLYPAAAWLNFARLCGIVGWILMFIYQEQARKLQSDLPMAYNAISLHNIGSITSETGGNEDGTCTP